jgi:hypothetical protein
MIHSALLCAGSPIRSLIFNDLEEKLSAPSINSGLKKVEGVAAVAKINLNQCDKVSNPVSVLVLTCRFWILHRLSFELIIF